MVNGPSRGAAGTSASKVPSSRRSLALTAEPRVSVRPAGAPAASSAGLACRRRRRRLRCRRGRRASSSGTAPEPTASRTISKMGRPARRAARVTASSSSASRRHGPAVRTRARARSANGSASARRACSRSRISGASKRLMPPATVYGMPASRRRATIASRCLCLRYRTAKSVQGTAGLPPRAGSHRASVVIRSTMAAASSSGPAQVTSSTAASPSRCAARRLSGS